MPKLPYTAALGTLFALGSCAAADRSPLHYYLLAPPQTISSSNQTGELTVAEFDCLPIYQRRDMIHRQLPHRITHLRDIRWAASPGALIQHALLLGLSQRMPQLRLTSNETTHKRSLRLQGTVLAIEREQAQDGSCNAHLSVQVQLRKAEGQVTHSFNARKPCSCHNPDELGKALGMLSGRLVEQVQELLQGHGV